MKSAILFQNQPVFQLTEGSSQVLVSADHGARILRWTREEREIITWPAEADWGRVIKVRGGNPVLFPFIARHYVDGRMEFWRDEQGTVRPMPMHGFVRDAQFTVIDGEEENSLRMRLVDSAETRAHYPFAFQFDVVVSLQSGSRLEVRFETTNRSDQEMPYHAGHHFYLALPHWERADWSLHLPCASWGRQAPDGAIIHEEPASDTLRLDDPKLVDRFQIQPREAKVALVNNKNGRRLVFDLKPPGSVPWYAVTTWTQTADSDFYCIEPWLGLPNAIHHGEGLRKLAPGQMEIATCILDGSGW